MKQLPARPFSLCLAWMAALAPFAAASAQTDAMAAGEAPLEVTREGALVSLQGPAGAAYPFLLDSQAPLSTLHIGLAATFGLPLDETAHGSMEAYAATLPGFAAGAIPLYLGQGLLVDLEPLAHRMNRPLAGVLSLSAFPGPIRLDFPAGRLYAWVAGPSYRPPGALALRLDGDQARVRALVNGRRMLWFNIDLSQPEAIGMPEPLLRRLGALGPGVPQLTFLEDAGPQPAPRIRLAEFRLGSVAVSGPLCAVLPEGEAPWLGVGFFQDDALALSLRSDTPWLHPGRPRAASAAPVEGTGLVAWRRSAGQWLAQVIEGSPAGRLGLRPGDVIETVNERAAGPMDHSSLSRLLGQSEGSAVNVVCSRDDVRFDLVITCEKLF